MPEKNQKPTLKQVLKWDKGKPTKYVQTLEKSGDPNWIAERSRIACIVFSHGLIDKAIEKIVEGLLEYKDKPFRVNEKRLPKIKENAEKLCYLYLRAVDPKKLSGKSPKVTACALLHLASILQTKDYNIKYMLLHKSSLWFVTNVGGIMSVKRFEIEKTLLSKYLSFEEKYGQLKGKLERGGLAVWYGYKSSDAVKFVYDKINEILEKYGDIIKEPCV